MKRHEELLKHCQETRDLGLRMGADQIEVMAAWSRSRSVAFEKNDLQIAMSDEECLYGVRVIAGQRLGFASTNDLENIAATIADALAISRASITDPLHDLPDPRPLKEIDALHDEEVEALTMEDITTMGTVLLEQVRTRDARVSIDSGATGAWTAARALASSKGLAASTQSTQLSASLFGMAVDGDEVGSFATAGQAARARAGFEQALRQCADDFVRKTTGALSPGKGRSCQGSIILTPEATSSLLIGNLLAMLQPGAIRKGKSPLGNRLDEVIASPLLNLVDDATLPGEVDASPFDREGMPRHRSQVVQEGRLCFIPYNHYEARAAGIASGSTGHASGGPQGPPGVQFGRIEMAAGATPLKELLATGEPTMIVTRFSGSTNTVTGEFSGVVKNGFLLEGGEPRPVSEVLISGNLLDAFQAMEAVSRERERIFGRVPMPWVRLGGISVTAG